MFSYLYILYLGTLNILRFSYIYKAQRKSRSICIYIYYKAYLLAITILEHLFKRLLLKLMLSEDSLLSANSSNYKAFLIYIIYMLRLNLIELNFVAQYVKVQPILFTRVSNIVLVVYRCSKLRYKLIIIIVQEAQYLCLRDAVSYNI